MNFLHAELSLLIYAFKISFELGLCQDDDEQGDLSRSYGRTSPLTGERPVTIGTAFRIHSISDIDAVKTEFSVDATVQFYWYLGEDAWKTTKYVMKMSNIDYVEPGHIGVVPMGKMSQFWNIDPYFQEATEVTLPSTDTPNEVFFVANLAGTDVRDKGSAMMSLKVKQRLIVKCRMSFQDFPFDTQTCFLNLRSFSYPIDDLELEAADFVDEPVIVEQGPFLMESIVEVAPDCDYINPPNGAKYGGLCIRFTFRRQIFYQFLSSYLPSILLVLASFAPYFMSVESTPERLNVSITLLQAIITVFAQSRKSSLPSVSYSTRMDSYIYGCIYFVIVSIVQSIIVNILVNNQRRRLLRRLEGIPVSRTRKVIDVDGVHLRNRERLEEFRYRRQNLFQERDSLSTGWLMDWMHKFWRDIKSTGPVDFDKASGRIIPFSFVIFNIYYWVETSKLKN